MTQQAAPLAAIAQALRSGAQDVTATLAEALYHLNYVDSHLQAFLPEAGRRERIFAEAEALYAQYPEPDSRPPLFGVPVGIKDIFKVEGLPTQGGSTLPSELFEMPEADCVARLRAAGAIVLGKTVTTEFAFVEPGPTHNPHNSAHTPGGSSSGSAAAVAAGLVPLALGTQTVGSVIRPAAYCGVVGFKPSYGRIDPTGVLFVARSLDHVGIFTQDVEGMQLAASILCRDWSIDSVIESRPVLAVPEGPYLQQASPEGLAAFEDQVKGLESAGYTVRQVEVLDDIAEIDHNHMLLMAYEMAQEHAQWFAQYADRYRPRTVAKIRRGKDVSAIEAAAARESQAKLRERLTQRLAEAGADLWISPSAPGTAPEGLDSTGDPAMNLPWTHAGLPTVTVPAGWGQNNLPFGLQCAGAFGSDEQVLAWCEDLFAVMNRGE